MVVFIDILTGHLFTPRAVCQATFWDPRSLLCITSHLPAHRPTKTCLFGSIHSSHDLLTYAGRQPSIWFLLLAGVNIRSGVQLFPRHSDKQKEGFWCCSQNSKLTS